MEVGTIGMACAADAGSPHALSERVSRLSCCAVKNLRPHSDVRRAACTGCLTGLLNRTEPFRGCNGPRNGMATQRYLPEHEIAERDLVLRGPVALGTGLDLQHKARCCARVRQVATNLTMLRQNFKCCDAGKTRQRPIIGAHAQAQQVPAQMWQG